MEYRVDTKALLLLTSGKDLTFIKSDLSDRRTKVFCNGLSSGAREINICVRQVFLFGTILFLLDISDLPKNIHISIVNKGCDG